MINPDDVVKIMREGNAIRMEHFAVHQELSAISARIMVQLNQLAEVVEKFKSEEEKLQIMQLTNKYLLRLVQQTRSYVAGLSAISEQMKNEMEDMEHDK